MGVSRTTYQIVVNKQEQETGHIKQQLEDRVEGTRIYISVALF